MKRSQFVTLTVVLLALGVVVGCKSAATIAANAQFRVMNASVQQPSLTFLLTTTTLSSSLAYPTASGYAPEAPGGYTVHVQPAGTTNNLINLPVVFQQGTVYTFIAAPAGLASPALAPILLTDDNTAPSSGSVKLRIVNASPDIGNVDVYIVAPGTNIQSKTPTISNLAFQAASSYQTLTAGTYEVFFTATGQKAVLIDTGALGFGSTAIRTLVAVDSSGGFTSSLLLDLN